MNSVYSSDTITGKNMQFCFLCQLNKWKIDLRFDYIV